MTTKTKTRTAKLVLVPVSNHITVKLDEGQGETEGGILLPDTVKTAEVPMWGTILAVGPGKVDEDGNFHGVDRLVGEKIVFGRYAGHDLDHPLVGKVKIITDEDVLACIEEEDDV